MKKTDSPVTTIEFPSPALHKKFKLYCLRKDITMKEFFLSKVREALEENIDSSAPCRRPLSKDW